jgi:hypothetical protein
MPAMAPITCDQTPWRYVEYHFNLRGYLPVNSLGIVPSIYTASENRDGNFGPSPIVAESALDPSPIVPARGTSDYSPECQK